MLDDKRLLELYGLYKKELYIYLVRLSRSNELAEDILHDCFVNLIQYSRKYDLKDINIRSFLYKTAHNLCINALKRNSFLHQVPVEEDSKVTNDSVVTGNLEFEELNNTVYALLQKVDEVSRSIFIMRKELDMDPSDIARNLNISERTVRRKIAKVLEYLMESLKKSGYLSVFFLINGIISIQGCFM